MEEKLTFPQIVNLVATGQQDKIPSGYNIKWVGGQEPKTLYDYVIPREDVILAGNNVPPVPDEVHINGELVVQPYYGDEAEEPVEHGDVFLMTRFNLSELKFHYRPNMTCGKELIEYIEKYVEAVNERQAMKKDLVFDGEFHVENLVFKLHVMMPVSWGLANEEEVSDTVLDFVYDYMSQEIIDDVK